jgi:superfamily II DNA or RNA helicase
MPFGEGYRKSNHELEGQLDSAEQILDKPESSLVPPSVRREGILDMPIEEIREKYSRRYDTYVKLLRDQRARENEDTGNLSDQELKKMRNWLGALNSLDSYIQEHYKGQEQTLRSRQINVFEDLRDFTEEGGNEGYIKLPTGVGKTVLFTEFIEAVNLKTLVVVPTKLLVQQTKTSMGKFAPDLDVGRIYGGAKELGRTVTITTYDSFISQVKEGKIKPEDYDCLILDEAHTSLSERRAETVDKFSNALRIGFTATPEYSSEKNVKGLLENEIHAMSIREAVEEGLLSSFSALVARTQIDLSQVRTNERTGEYTEKELEKAVNVAGRNKAAVDLYKKNFNSRTGVAYCIGVKHASAVAEAFNKSGVTAAHISGEMTEKVQQSLLARFKKGELKILCNADILIAGFDEPKASICLNLRPTRSRVVAEQRGGRVLRINERDLGKHAYVIDFLDNDANGTKPPVLFADVAEGAEFHQVKKGGVGTETVPPEKVLTPILDIPNLEIITDVREVMRIVTEFREKEKAIEERQHKEFLSLIQLMEEVRANKIVSSGDYYKNYQKHPGWPSLPPQVYKNEWQGWDEFLGREAKEFLPYEQLKEEVRSAGFQSSTQYTRNYKKHKGWPATPSQIYESEWEGWDQFLGRPEALSYMKFREQVLAAGVRTVLDYKKVFKQHGWMAQPEYFYEDEWPGWTEFLARYKSYDELKTEVKNAGIKAWPEYKARYKEHAGWPRNPDRFYKENWPGWDEFFEREAPPSYAEFQIQVLSKGIRSSLEYNKVYKEYGWPSDPSRIYEQWPGWNEFLEKYLTYQNLQDEVLRASISNNVEYRQEAKKRKNWPSSPETFYKSEWPGWREFLRKK